ncbi:MAG: hypothetical protein EOP61_14035 [Sphingomonadales bacterium]|nr:MAG: hypothetical protein EOP61_14035 [Sphingomonadales bacterium]
MLKKLAILAALAAAPALVPHAQAQNAPTNGVLLIYGDDKCPTNTDGDEIVVCQRLDEAERFRIPKTLREQAGRPQANESWAVRSQGALDAGKFGAGSCSAVGVGGTTGCFVQQATAAKKETKARKEAEENLPLP